MGCPICLRSGQLRHQLVVDVQAAGGVDQQEVVAHRARLVDRRAQDLPRVGQRLRMVDRDLARPAERAQLLARRRAVDVRRDHQRVMPALLEPAPELGRAGRLARTLQAGHQHDRRELRRRGEAHGLAAAAEHRDHLVAHDAEHGLVRGEALEDVLADGALAHALEELLHDLEVDVGLEQGETDLAQRDVDVGGRERTASPEGPEDTLQPLAQRIEHVGPLLLAVTRTRPLIRHRRPRKWLRARLGGNA